MDNKEVEILENDLLHRTLPLQPSFIIKETGKITSAVFKLSSRDKAGDNALSVNLERLVTDINNTFNSKTHGLVKIEARVPFSLECDCVHTPESDNYAHSSILGVNNNKARKLSRSCIIYYPST